MINKLQSKLYHNVIWHSLVFTIGLCLLIIGFFYNYEHCTLSSVQQTIFAISLALLSCSMVFMFLILSICIKLNKSRPSQHVFLEKDFSEYDLETGLLYPEAFYKKVKDYTLVSSQPACMVTFHAEIIEQFSRIKENTTPPFSSITNIFLPSAKETFFSALKSRHEYLVFIHGYNKPTTLDIIETMHQDVKSELLKLFNDDSLCTVECGYAWYPSQGKTLNDLITNANFALFEAICFNKVEKNEFTPSSYQKQKIEFKRNDRFEQLMNSNCFQYHFQPIISAKSGDIYGYEALMRTDETIGLNPIEILEIAERQNRLYEIEYYTFFNIFKLYKEKYSSFADKYLFINCLPNQLLTKEDFDLLYKKYKNYSQKIVVEASEIYVHTEEDHLLLLERINTLGVQLALDDYGSGYGNELNLLKYNPKFIKIDRRLISNIDNDERKKHLVSNIIEFAKLHGMISLAEGIETFKELHTVIFLGIDLLQGFYLYRPNPELMTELPKKKKDEISAINLKYLKSTANYETYIADEDGELEVPTLSNDNFSTLLINTDTLKLIGDAATNVIFTISIPDNSKVTLELQNINISSPKNPCINIGRNCQVELKLSGNNYLTGQGILVPESSKLTITGRGNLTIRTNASNSIGIGESPFNTYGSITINIRGKLAVHNKKENAICIGGGIGNTASKIELINGHYILSTDGDIAIAVGCIDGQANIELGKITMKIHSNGTNSLGIGCLNGSLNLSSYADITMKQTGQNSCCIGVLSTQKGCILLLDGIIILKLNAREGCTIGSINGNMYIKIAVQECICLIQGIHMCGIGNYMGSGVTEIQKGAISVKLAAASKLYLGSQNGSLLINGGNINCPINKSIKPINKYRIPLQHYKFAESNTFSEHIEIDNLAYDYEAYTTDYIKELNVYLPEFREYEQFLCD